MGHQTKEERQRAARARLIKKVEDTAAQICAELRAITTSTGFLRPGESTEYLRRLVQNYRGYSRELKVSDHTADGVLRSILLSGNPDGWVSGWQAVDTTLDNFGARTHNIQFRSNS